MRAKHSFRSANRGGCPFLYALHIAKEVLFPPPFFLPFLLHRGKFSAYRGKFSAKMGKSEFFLACFGVFSGKSETKNGKNKDIFYFRGFRGAAFILFCGGGGGVHWVQVVGLSGVCRSFRGVFPPFCPCFSSLCCFACGRLLANMALFAILRGVSAWFGVQVYIYMG